MCRFFSVYYKTSLFSSELHVINFFCITNTEIKMSHNTVNYFQLVHFNCPFCFSSFEPVPHTTWNISHKKIKRKKSKERKRKILFSKPLLIWLPFSIGQSRIEHLYYFYLSHKFTESSIILLQYWNEKNQKENSIFVLFIYLFVVCAFLLLLLVDFYANGKHCAEMILRTEIFSNWKNFSTISLYNV